MSELPPHYHRKEQKGMRNKENFKMTVMAIGTILILAGAAAFVAVKIPNRGGSGYATITPR